MYQLENATMSGYKSYQNVQNVTENPRSVEYRLLGQVTSALLEADQNLGDIAKKANAIIWNQKVWNAFREDLVDPTNKLPIELKAQLISLSIFVNRYSSQALSIENQKSLSPLIDINKNIMEGLAGNVDKPAS